MMLALAAVATVSCVDTDYDLSKLNTEITVGGDSLAIPIGETAQLLVSDLLGEGTTEFLKIDEDGGYILFVNDTIGVDSEMPSISTQLDLGGLAPSVEIEILNFADVASAAASYIALLSPTTELPLSDYLPTSTPVDTSIQVAVELELPEGVKDLSKVVFTEDSKISVELSLLNCPLTAGELTPDIDVDFSQLLSLTGGGVIDLSELKLNEDNGYQASRQYGVQELVVASGDFNVDEHKLSLDKKVTVSGSVVITGAKTVVSQLTAAGVMKVKVAVSLDDLALSRVEAKVGYSLSQEEMTLDMSDLSGAFGDKMDLTLDLHNPFLGLQLITNLGIPATVSATLIPYKDDQPKTESQIQVDLSINGAPSAEVRDTVRYFLAALDEQRDPAFTFVEADIAGLVKLMPDSVRVRFEVETDDTKTAVLEPSASYLFEAIYEVGVPLQVGPDFRVALSDTISVGSVGKYLSRVEEAALTGSVENTLPLNLMMTVTFTDDNYTRIPLAKPAQQLISAGKLDGSATVSELDLAVKFADPATAENATQAIVCFEVTAGGVARSVKPTDYVKAKLVAGIVGGITLDPGEFITSEGKE